MPSELDALQEAVAIAGGQTALAAKLGEPIKQGHVWYWLHRLKKSPPEWVLAIETLTGVSRHQLRPDLYPPPTAPSEAA